VEVEGESEMQLIWSPAGPARKAGPSRAQVSLCDGPDSKQFGTARQRIGRETAKRNSAESHGSAHLKGAASLTFSACPLTLDPASESRRQTVARDGMSSLRGVLSFSCELFGAPGPSYPCQTDNC